MAVEKMEIRDIFTFLQPEMVDAISNAAEMIRLRRGDTVYSKGENASHLYVLLKGQVALRLPGKGGFNVLIDEISPGGMFGSCICFALDCYALTAQCMGDSQLLKIDAGVLKNRMDEDLRMGYAIQSRISQIYFNRYIDTMNKLQAIVMNIPTTAD